MLSASSKPPLLACRMVMADHRVLSAGADLMGRSPGLSMGEAAQFYENFECLEVLGEGLSSVVRR